MCVCACVRACVCVYVCVCIVSAAKFLCFINTLIISIFINRLWTKERRRMTTQRSSSRLAAAHRECFVSSALPSGSAPPWLLRGLTLPHTQGQGYSYCGKKYRHDCLGRVTVTATVGDKANILGCFVDWRCDTHRVTVTATVGKNTDMTVLAGSRLQLPWETKPTCLTASWTDAATYTGSRLQLPGKKINDMSWLGQGYSYRGRQSWHAWLLRGLMLPHTQGQGYSYQGEKILTCLGWVKVTATVGDKANMLDCFVDWCCHTHRVKVTATRGKKYWHVLAGSRLQLPWETKPTCLTASWTDAATHTGSRLQLPGKKNTDMSWLGQGYSYRGWESRHAWLLRGLMLPHTWGQGYSYRRKKYWHVLAGSRLQLLREHWHAWLPYGLTMKFIQTMKFIKPSPAFYFIL